LIETDMRSLQIGVDVTVFRFWVYQNRYHLIIVEGKSLIND